MLQDEPMRVGYVVKRYPRYSETFVVNEILAHEAAGLPIEIFALFPSSDTHFQDIISLVRAPVNYLMPGSIRASEFWSVMQQAANEVPDIWNAMDAAVGEEARDVHQALLLATLVKRKGITHLHAHFATSATSVARMASRFAGIPFSFTAHAKDIFHETVRESDLRRKLREASAAVTVSEFNLAHLREHFGDDGARVKRIYNGVDLNRLQFVPAGDRPPLVLAIGRLVQKKGFHVLLDACSLLMKQNVEFRCLIVGSGEEEAALKAQHARLGLDSRVELTGPRPQREVFELLQQAAVFAAPCVVGPDSNRDGLPTVLLEAMALGAPCISTAVTGIPEAVRDGHTGIIVAQHDPVALADSIRRLLSDAVLRSRLAVQGRRLVEEQFEVTRNAACLREVFEQAHQSRSFRREVVLSGESL